MSLARHTRRNERSEGVGGLKPQPRKPKPTRDTWGSITAMPGGGWRLRYPGPDGRRRSGGVFRTKAAAEQARAKLHTAVAGGVWRPSAPGDSPTLAVYADAWLTRAARSESSVSVSHTSSQAVASACSRAALHSRVWTR